MLIATTLPLQIVFYRVPVNEPKAQVEKPPPRRRPGATSSAAADLAAAFEYTPEPPQSQLARIFGTVSKVEIAEAAKAVLAQSEEGAKVVLGADDITYKSSDGEDRGVEGDELKALGDFPIEVRVKGGEAVQRVVSVRAEDAQ